MKIPNYIEFTRTNPIYENYKDTDTELINNIGSYLNDIKNDIIEGDSNIDVEKTLHEMKKKFGNENIKILNTEALLRKIFQILKLRPKNTEERIIRNIDRYVDGLAQRMEKQREKFPKEEYFDRIEQEESILPRKRYEGEKYDIQVELLKLQEWVIKNNKKVAIVFEGRDAAGKGSTIKRFIEYLNPKHFRVVALGVPTEEEKNNWFKRYEEHLPHEGEIVFFDRSWYNRAVVEPVMGYCTEEQYKDFMSNVNMWESKLIDDGVILIKFWFSITKEKQLQRFNIRQESPLKYWKFSPNDAKVVDKFEMIGDFKNEMFQKTSTEKSPWVIVNSNDKKIGRLNAMRYVLDTIDYEGKDATKADWYPEVINILK